MHAEYETLTTPVVQVRNVYSLLDFQSFDTRRERHTIFTRLTVPTSPTVNSPSWTGPAQSQMSTNVFFEITKNLGPSFPGITSFTPQSHFLTGGFIMTFVIVISSAHERELYSMCATPALALSRIVQSPTKPNDKI